MYRFYAHVLYDYLQNTNFAAFKSKNKYVYGNKEVFSVGVDDGYVTPLAIRGGSAANDDDSVVRVKSGNKLIIQNGSGGVIIEDSFECEEGAVFEIK